MSFDLLSGEPSEISMSILDEDLSFLAIQAALELDMLIAGKETGGSNAIKKLSEVMSGRFKPLISSEKTVYLDPATTTIMNRAFIASENTVTTVEELIEKAIKLADELATQSQQVQAQRNGELEKIKKFCIALARCSAAYRETIIGPRTKHPYRK